MQCDEMVRRVETRAGVGLFYYELAAVPVTAQEQYWLPRRYGPAPPRCQGEAFRTHAKQRRAGADVEALKLSGEDATTGYRHRQRSDFLHGVKHGEHSAIGND